MSFADTANTLGRVPVELVEIDLPVCTRTFGSAPCTATGVQCWHTWNTCKDRNNYASATRTYRFCSQHLAAHLPTVVGGSPVQWQGASALLPLIKSTDYSPARIEAGKGVGLRATLTVTLVNMPDTGQDSDQHLSARTQPAGTFWPLFLARNKYLEGRTLRLYQGFAVSGVLTLADCRVSTWELESVTGPDASDRLVLRARDPLAKAWRDNAQLPAPSERKLAAPLLAAATTATIDGTSDQVDATFGATGVCLIGDELCNYTHPLATNTLGLTRATRGTVAEDRDTGDTVQPCQVWASAAPEDVLQDLLTAAGLTLGQLDTAGWAAEALEWFGGLTITTLLARPTKIQALLDELMRDLGAILWWDAEAALVRLRALAPPADPPQTLSEDDSLLARVSPSQQSADRLSRVFFWYRLIDAIKEPSAENCASLYAAANPTAESAQEYGQPASRTIYSRWITTDDQALQTASRMLASFRDAPRRITAETDARLAAGLSVGDQVGIVARAVTGPDGTPTTLVCRVHGIRPTESGHKYQLQLMEQAWNLRFARVMADAAPDFTGASTEQKNRGGFIADTITERMSDGSEYYRIF